MVHSPDGMRHLPGAAAPKTPVVEPGAFVIAATHLDHGHIYGMVEGLVAAGATLRWVFDTDPERVRNFQQAFPQVQIADDWQRVLDDEDVRLVACAAIPSQRGPIGLEVLQSGKDYYVDKSPFTTLAQLADARRVVEETGRKYMVYYSERLHSESAMHATTLVREGAIGRVLQVLILAPHRLNKPSRPAWFFKKSCYGGILTDIGSHQFEQFLTYAGAAGGRVDAARVENFAHPDVPELEDFGEAHLTMDNGVSCSCRLDWFTPDGLRSWGDGRCFVLGDAGTIEIRKYIDVARDSGPDRIFLVDREGEHEIDCRGTVGFTFPGELIQDCLHRTETAMTQEHAFKAAELSMQAQSMADAARSGG
jgi:predicted dehydrogenase